MPIDKTMPLERPTVRIDKRDALAVSHGVSRATVDTVIDDAATTEKIKPARMTALLDLPDPVMRGLVNHITELTDPAGLPEWRQAFPTVLGSLSDEEASAVIRVAEGIATAPPEPVVVVAVVRSSDEGDAVKAGNAEGGIPAVQVDAAVIEAADVKAVKTR